MTTITRFRPYRGFATLQDQVNRIFNETAQTQGEETALTTWAPSVDIYETPNELVVKADLPEVNEKEAQHKCNQEDAHGTPDSSPRSGWGRRIILSGWGRRIGREKEKIEFDWIRRHLSLLKAAALPGERPNKAVSRLPILSIK